MFVLVLFVYSSIYPSIHLSIHLSIHPSIHPSIHSSIRSSIHLFISQLTDITLTSTHSGIRITQVVAGPRFNASTDDGFALALTDQGEVYSWGKSTRGRLGQATTDNVRSPRIVEALSGKDIKMVSGCGHIKICTYVRICAIYSHMYMYMYSLYVHVSFICTCTTYMYMYVYLIYVHVSFLCTCTPYMYMYTYPLYIQVHLICTYMYMYKYLHVHTRDIHVHVHIKKVHVHICTQVQ